MTLRYRSRGSNERPTARRVKQIVAGFYGCHGELRWLWWQPVRTRFGEDLEFGENSQTGFE